MACCVLAGLVIYYLTLVRKKAASMFTRSAVLTLAVSIVAYLAVFHGEHIAYELGMTSLPEDHSHHH